MSPKTFWGPSALFISALCSVACGGSDEPEDDGNPSDDGDSGQYVPTTEISSGADESTPVSMITDEEALALCKSTHAYTVESLPPEAFCGAAGVTSGLFAELFGGDPVEACEEAIVFCSEDPAMASDEEAEAECAGTTAPTDCDATVGELELCYQDHADALADAMRAFEWPACSELNDEVIDLSQDADLTVDPKDIPSCAKLEEACWPKDEE